MGSIIITMRKPENAHKISGALKKRGFRPDLICHTAADALSECCRRDEGVVICGSRLPDMSFLEFRDCLPGTFRIIILTGNVMSDEYPADAVKLTLPLKLTELVSVLEKEVPVERHQESNSEIKPVRNAEDRKYIDKAKAVLMEKRGMSEPEAYRYIQKSSMDNSNSMVETAQMILLLNA